MRKTDMVKNIKFIISVLIAGVLLISSCADKNLERRINALERRVQALERENVPAPPVSEKVSLAAPPKKVQPKADISKIVFESLEYDFGTINDGDIINHTFTFNTFLSFFPVRHAFNQ